MDDDLLAYWGEVDVVWAQVVGALLAPACTALRVGVPGCHAHHLTSIAPCPPLRTRVVMPTVALISCPPMKLRGCGQGDGGKAWARLVSAASASAERRPVVEVGFSALVNSRVILRSLHARSGNQVWVIAGTHTCAILDSSIA